MDNNRLIITAIVEQCRRLIQEAQITDSPLPAEVQPKQLLWMCEQVEENAESGSISRLHRWMGFIQAGMLANRIIGLDDLKSLCDELKVAHQMGCQDLFDHLDPTNAFELDIGGQG